MRAGSEIPIELVALSLVSVDPVNIGGTDFDVFVNGAGEGGIDGSMTIIQEDADGGFFEFTLFLGILAFNLVEVGNPSNEFCFFLLDCDIPLQTFLFNQGEGQWSHMAPPHYPIEPDFPNGGFFPGSHDLFGAMAVPVEVPEGGTCEPPNFFDLGIVCLELFDYQTHIVLAQITEPIPAPEFSGTLYGMPNFGWIFSLGGSLLGMVVIRRRRSRG